VCAREFVRGSRQGRVGSANGTVEVHMPRFLSRARVIGASVSLLAPSCISGLGRRRSPRSIGSENPLLHIFRLAHAVPQGVDAAPSCEQGRFLGDGLGRLMRGRRQGRRGTWNLRKR
jgi:hypothetical protein